MLQDFIPEPIESVCFKRYVYGHARLMTPIISAITAMINKT